jgi:hypothetical protein
LNEASFFVKIIPEKRKAFMTMDDLHNTVRAQCPRIGRPVFVRFTAFGLIKENEMIPRLVRMVRMVGEWIDQSLDRLQAVGSPASGQMCLTLQFRKGATALVSIARISDRRSGIDLLILGNHGSILYDFAAGNCWDAQFDLLPNPVDPTMQSVIEQALRGGQPVKKRLGKKA